MSTILFDAIKSTTFTSKQEQRLTNQEQSLGRRGEKGLKAVSVQTQSGTEVVPQMSAKYVRLSG